LILYVTKIIDPLHKATIKQFELTFTMNTYGTCCFPIRNVVALKEPIDRSFSKQVFLDRGMMELQKAYGKDYFQIKFTSRETKETVAIIPIHYITGGDGKHIKSKSGLRKNQLTLELSQLFDTNVDYLERLIVKMDRGDAEQFAAWFLFAWNADERRNNNKV
jgi:hypothetical protein